MSKLTPGMLNGLRKAIADSPRSDGVGEAFRLDVLHLIRWVEKLQADIGDLRQIVEAVAGCEAIAIPYRDTGEDVIALRHSETNVLWIREQARKWLAEND